MTEVASVVFVVDDDPSICRAIKRLVQIRWQRNAE